MFDIQDPNWLARVMDEKGVQTGELAKRSGVSRSQIQRIRNGMEPRLGTLRSIQAALAELGIAA